MSRQQVLEFGKIRRDKIDTTDVLYYLAGKRMYSIGAMSGRYPPLGWRRPGFLVGKRLAEVGPEARPTTSAHLLREMGGVWSHPMKSIEDLWFTLEDEQGRWELRESTVFTHHLSHVEFYFEKEDVGVTRRDFVVEDEPALFVMLRLGNRRSQSYRCHLHLTVEVNLMPSWFSGRANGSDELVWHHGDTKITAYDSSQFDKWGLVFGAQMVPLVQIGTSEEGRSVATLTYHFNLGAGQETEIHFLFAADPVSGFSGAGGRFNRLIGRGDRLLREKKEFYRREILGGVRFACPERHFTDSFYLAKANLVMLQAEPTPYLHRYLYGGIPEYVQLFGTDTAYSIPGLMDVGYREVARSALLELGEWGKRLCGRIPHEITTTGRVFHPGNTQETPQFTIACWNYFRWTGDLAFLHEVYPLCREGVLDYVLAHWDLDLDFYPDGNGMVERQGMGPEKLDSVVYFCQAVYALAGMADALDREKDARDHRELADSLRSAINQDFWMEAEGIWADSLQDDHTRQLDGHWTVVVPMETGIAEPDKALRALRTIEKEWVSEWGMVHTRAKEDLVWTLPTGLLALAEFAYGNEDLGLRLLKDIAVTTDHGMLGAYKELIPEGLCHVQLWSPAIFLQGVVEGIFGVSPRADRDYVDLFPKLPSQWDWARLEELAIGEHQLSILLERRECEYVMVRHGSSRGGVIQGRLQLYVEGRPRVVDAEGRPVEHCSADVGDRQTILLEFRLEPDQELTVTKEAAEIRLRVEDTVARP